MVYFTSVIAHSTRFVSKSAFHFGAKKFELYSPTRRLAVTNVLLITLFRVFEDASQLNHQFLRIILFYCDRQNSLVAVVCSISNP